MYKKSKLRGYIIKQEALNEIVSFASGFPGCEGDAISLVLDNLPQDSCTTIFHFLSHFNYIIFCPIHFNFFVFVVVAVQSLILDKDEVHRAVSKLLATDKVGEESPDTVTSTSALCIINAFDIPKFRYDPIKKIFHLYVFPPFIYYLSHSLICEQLKNENHPLDS